MFAFRQIHTQQKCFLLTQCLKSKTFTTGMMSRLYRRPAAERTGQQNGEASQMRDVEWSEELLSASSYPTNVDPARDQAYLSRRPSVDPKSTTVMLFPGEGSQFVGMGRNLLRYPLVREMYQIASAVLDYDIQDLCLNGPKEELDRTVYSQPAILVTSLAAVQKLKAEAPSAIEQCISTSGFGVGELAALVFAGTLSFENAIKLSQVRAEAMQAASELVPSGMMTVFLKQDSHIKYACVMAEDWCRKVLDIQDPCCQVACFLGPTCKVVAGNEEALQFIEQNASEFGILRYKRLPVSGAFYTRLMVPAQPGLRAKLDGVQIKGSSIPVHCNTDGKMYTSPNHIRKALVYQISRPVRWEQMMHVLFERNKDVDYPVTYECGPGHSLKNILNMINRKACDQLENVEV